MHSFETLRDKPCRTLLKLLQEKGKGYIQEAAARLTPYVKAIYNGNLHLPRLQLELLDELRPASIDTMRIIELCTEAHLDYEGQTDVMVCEP